MALDITRRADGQRALVQEEDYQYHVQSLSHQVITEMAVIQAQREKVDGNAATAIGAGGRGMLARCLARELRAGKSALPPSRRSCPTAHHPDQNATPPRPSSAGAAAWPGGRRRRTSGG